VTRESLYVHEHTIDDVPRLDMRTAERLGREPVVPELLPPLLARGERELRAALAERRADVGEPVLDDLLDGLSQTLAVLTNGVVLQRFSSYHLVLDPFWRPRPTAPGHAPAGAARDVLDAYIDWETSVERLLGDDGPYPELGRLVRVTMHNWLAASLELVDRVARHRDGIAAVVGVAAHSLPLLGGVEFGVSDPHGGGRTVAILRFGEHRVVYKPRSLDAEYGFTELAARVLQDALALSTFDLRIARFADYGFMRFVPTTSCADLAAVRRCYWRYGGLLALAHALGTVDLHHENVIVTGEYPVVIDAEPLFRSGLALSEGGRARMAFERDVSTDGLVCRQSVLELGIVPMTMRPPMRELDRDVPAEVDIGALCAFGLEPVENLVPCGLGSDDLQVRSARLTTGDFPNLPVLDGRPQLPQDFLDELTSAFEHTHQYLCAHRDEYTGPGGLLDRFATSRVRLLARATMDYSAVLARSLSPEVMRSTEARAEQIRGDLSRLGAARLDAVGDLVPAECTSLLDADIPWFGVTADQDTVDAAALLTAPVDGARERWGSMDDVDRELQADSIRQRITGADRVTAVAVPRTTDGEALERHAFTIVEDLVAAGRTDADGPVWTSACYAAGISSVIVHADREALYEGAAGIAVALAEAGRLADCPEWTDLAVRVFAPIVHGAPPASARRTGGIARGLGGLIYAMVRVGEAADAPGLVDAAHRVALEHAPGLAGQDSLDEVLYGNAGLLLALLALHERRPDPLLATIADSAAETLLTRAVRTSTGVSWQPVPHVSHGGAGVAMALARWARLRNAEYGARTAQAALDHEASYWRAEARGWVDGRVSDQDEPSAVNWTWCNGRTGALLARLAVAEALEVPFTANWHAGEALSAEPTDMLVEMSGGLCCGTPGAVDALLEIHRRDHTHPLAEPAATAIDTLATGTLRSHYNTLAGSLFAGSAGLAFALLRAARPDDVPSLLWFG
jgi:type 2 lantibiotic biosynthesis protein LanM